MPQPSTPWRAKAIVAVLALTAIGLYGLTLFRFGVMIGAGQ